MPYQLMNQDKCLLDFICRRNEFEEVECVELQWHSPLRPIGFTDLTAFLERRKAPKHRANIAELLHKYGCEDLEGFLLITHALSLNDTFWVKTADSTLTWADVSLYQNAFDEVISRTAFDGTASSQSFSSTSPEFGTDGTYAKCWVREGHNIYLYKTGSPLFEIEPLSEYLASQLAAVLCPGAVQYDLAMHHGKLVSKCKLFTDEATGFAQANRIFRKAVSLPELLVYFESIGAGDRFRRICVLDALIFNPDRHYGNFGVLFDTATMQITGMAPAFDYNKALFTEVDDDAVQTLSWYAARCAPRLGADFNVTANELLTPSIRADLKNLSGFCFTQHPRFHSSPARLSALSYLVNRQIDLILQRVPVATASQQKQYDFVESRSAVSVHTICADAKDRAAELNGGQAPTAPAPELDQN